jgi:hypothetical protein
MAASSLAVSEASPSDIDVSEEGVSGEEITESSSA